MKRVLAVILAGGEGERLSLLSAVRAKASELGPVVAVGPGAAASASSRAETS